MSHPGSVAAASRLEGGGLTWSCAACAPRRLGAGTTGGNPRRWCQGSRHPGQDGDSSCPHGSDEDSVLSLARECSGTGE